MFRNNRQRSRTSSHRHFAGRRSSVFHIEQLECRQMLSGAPPTALDDTYSVGPINPLNIDSVNDGPGFRLTEGVTDPGPGGGGISIGDQQFVMIRFSVSTIDPMRTYEMGGQFGGFRGNGYIFGAIVALTDENDVPDSVDLSTPDVLGTTLIPVFNEADPDRSFITSGKLSVELSRGFYAAVFGSGKFGATSDGFSPFVSSQNHEYILLQHRRLVGYAESYDPRLCPIGRRLRRRAGQRQRPGRRRADRDG